MSWLSYLNFASFLGCVLFAAVSLQLNRRDRVNRSFAALASTMGVWALGYTFLAGLQTDRFVRLWYRVSSLGWVLFVPALVLFVHSLVHPTRKVPKAAIAAGVLWAAVLLAYQRLDTVLVVGFVNVAHGWAGRVDLARFPAIVYGVGLVGAFAWSAVTLALAIRRERLPVRRAPSAWVLAALVFDFVVGVGTGILVPATHKSFPNLTLIAFFVSLIPPAMLVARRRFLQIDYRLITEEVIDTLSDAIIITTPGGIVSRINRAGREYFGIDRLEPGVELRTLLNEPSIADAMRLATQTIAPRDSFVAPPIRTPGGDIVNIRVHSVVAPGYGVAAFIVVLSLERAPDAILDAYALTRQEKTVAAMVLSGHTNREIADTLCISYGTVKNHVTSIFAKVGVGSRTEFLRVSRAQGVL